MVILYMINTQLLNKFIELFDSTFDEKLDKTATIEKAQKLLSLYKATYDKQRNSNG